MNGETINPHLPLNIICDHIVPTRPVNNDNGLSEVSQTSGRLAPRSKTSGRLFEFSYFPPPKFDNRVRIANKQKGPIIDIIAPTTSFIANMC